MHIFWEKWHQNDPYNNLFLNISFGRDDGGRQTHWTDRVHGEQERKETQRALENTQCISSRMHLRQTGVEEGIQSQTGCVFAIPLHHTYKARRFEYFLLRGNADKDKRTAAITR